MTHVVAGETLTIRYSMTATGAEVIDNGDKAGRPGGVAIIDSGAEIKSEGTIEVKGGHGHYQTTPPGTLDQ